MEQQLSSFAKNTIGLSVNTLRSSCQIHGPLDTASVQSPLRYERASLHSGVL
jgi:hypothetical protein